MIAVGGAGASRNFVETIYTQRMNNQRDMSRTTGHDGLGEMMARVITGALDAVVALARRFGMGSGTAAPSRMPGLASSIGGTRRSIVGYINSGLYKIEQARRLSALARQYSGALQTIKLTHRAIRSAPSASRSLFQGYNRVLRDAKRSVRVLHTNIRQTDRHLRRYNPHTLIDEIARLERRLAEAQSERERADLGMIIDARRDLLASVEALDAKLSGLGHNLNSLAAALEVNHIRVITITGRSTSTSESDLLNARMEEATIQLALLEESLRELDESRMVS